MKNKAETSIRLMSKLSRVIALTSFWVLLMILSIFLSLWSGELKGPAEQNIEGVPNFRRLSLPEAVDLQGDQEISYGYELLTNTDQILGLGAIQPSMRYTGNDLRCTSCHLMGATQPYGLSLVGADKRFPQYRAREDRIGSLADRINGCMTRSMNGKALDESQPEMLAMIAYISWLDDYFGTEAETRYPGLKDIELPNRSANLTQGEELYQQYCAVCHQKDGQGVSRESENFHGEIYPALWGPASYNSGAGMNRVITAAGFIKYNMPFGISYTDPILSDEQAYDLAGYINSMERPQRDGLEKDFPDLRKKPMSTPYGPYADEFDSIQHKYGPYAPIKRYYLEKFQMVKTK